MSYDYSPMDREARVSLALGMAIGLIIPFVPELSIEQKATYNHLLKEINILFYSARLRDHSDE